MNIQPNDLLWKFYCKRFTIEGKQVEAPSNLCPYFWTSIKGFGLWLNREVRLRTLFFTALAATAALFCGAWLLKSVVGSIPASIFLSVLMVVWITSLTILFYSAQNRLWRWLEARPPVKDTVALLFMGFLIAIAIWGSVSGTLLSDMQRQFFTFLWLVGYGVAAIFIIVIAALLLSKAPSGHLRKLERTFQTIGAYARATKKGVCPGVTPPPGFNVKK